MESEVHSKPRRSSAIQELVHPLSALPSVLPSVLTPTSFVTPSAETSAHVTSPDSCDARAAARQEQGKNM